MPLWHRHRASSTQGQAGKVTHTNFRRAEKSTGGERQGVRGRRRARGHRRFRGPSGDRGRRWISWLHPRCGCLRRAGGSRPEHPRRPLRHHRLEPPLPGHRKAGDGAAVDRRLVGRRGRHDDRAYPPVARAHLAGAAAGGPAAADAGGAAGRRSQTGRSGTEPAARADTPPTTRTGPLPVSGPSRTMRSSTTCSSTRICAAGTSRMC